MADLSITSIAPQGNFPLPIFTAGESISLGDLFYIDGTTGKATRGSHTTAAASGGVEYIALHAAALDENIVGIPADRDVKTNGGMTVGPYYLSANAGKICPWSDLGTGDYIVLVGFAKSATVLHTLFYRPGITA